MISAKVLMLKIISALPCEIFNETEIDNEEYEKYIFYFWFV
jgi:hypothetical protein